MMLSYEYLNDAVELSSSKIPVLVIENKKIFRQALRSFLDDTVEELFTFSQDFKPFDFNKRGFFISNAIDLDFQNKKLVNKINSLMQKTAVNECGEDLVSIQTLLINLFDKLNKDCLREVLVKEQHGLCVYCMSRIENTADSTVIEHWYPLSKSKERALKYENLFASCYGGQKKTVNDARRICCCDAKKHDAIIDVD
ncbi:type II-A CRISPR-associated protein Csn2, partial [bacterium]|nr:type II-A CRISPR-associated protein Csn2 [bacterium]